MHNLNSIYSYTICLPNGAKTVASQGVVYLNLDLKLRNVLFIPELKYNLISSAQLARDSKCFISITDNFCVIKDCTSLFSYSSIVSYSNEL